MPRKTRKANGRKRPKKDGWGRKRDNNATRIFTKSFALCKRFCSVKSGGGVSIVGIVLMVAAFLVLRWKKWNPILVMLLCGIGGAAAHAFGWL